MSTMGSLERLEQSIYRSQIDHGLLDILMECLPHRDRSDVAR